MYASSLKNDIHLNSTTPTSATSKLKSAKLERTFHNSEKTKADEEAHIIDIQIRNFN